MQMPSRALTNSLAMGLAALLVLTTSGCGGGDRGIDEGIEFSDSESGANPQAAPTVRDVSPQDDEFGPPAEVEVAPPLDPVDDQP
jgi:hypothetical protein